MSMALRNLFVILFFNLQVGERAVLHCRVEGLRAYTVSWIRQTTCTLSTLLCTLVHSQLDQADNL